MSVGSAARVNDVLSVVPPFKGEEIIIKRHQGTPDIVHEVLEAHKQFTGDYDSIVENLKFYKTVPLEDQLFEFCKKNLHYEVETEDEQTTRSPAGIVELGKDPAAGVDCKHYAGYIAGVLDAWNRKAGEKVYDWCYRFASYDSVKAPGHVFVVTKYDDGELWIDPVLSSIDRRFPAPTFYSDKKPSGMLKRLSGVSYGLRDKKNPAGCGCDDSTMGTTSQNIASLVPVVAQIPAVGQLAAYVLDAAAIITSIFGGNYKTTSQVRWLLVYYYEKVLAKNIKSPTSPQLNENDVPAAQLWYSTVLGVPVNDMITFHVLNGTDWQTGKPLNNSQMDRVNNYFAEFVTAWPQFIVGVTPAMVLQAVKICEPMIADGSNPGEWAYMPAAPVVDPTATIVQNADGSYSISTPVTALARNAIQNAAVWARNNPIPAIAIGGAVGYGIYKLLND